MYAETSVAYTVLFTETTYEITQENAHRCPVLERVTSDYLPHVCYVPTPLLVQHAVGYDEQYSRHPMLYLVLLLRTNKALNMQFDCILASVTRLLTCYEYSHRCFICLHPLART